MPVNVDKQVTVENNDPAEERVSQKTTTQVPTRSEAQDARADRSNAWVWFIVGIIDLFLLLRFVFLLFGARNVGFTNTLYSFTSPLIAPFIGIFPTPSTTGSYFSTASVVAIIAYAILGWIVTKLIDLITRPASSKDI